MEKTLKVGLIGCGGMGMTHCNAIRMLKENGMNIEMTAIADCRKPNLDGAAAHFPNARTYEYGMDLINNEELDIVHICLPSYLHTEHTVAALEKNMNVFVEKPVCLTEDEVKALKEAQAKTGKKVMVGQVLRSWNEFLFLKDAYDTQKYGKLRSIIMQRVGGNPVWGFEQWFQDEKRSGSVVLDLHVHDLDFLRYMLGEPDSFDVKASEFSSGMVNHIVTSYEFGNVFAVAEALWDITTTLQFHGSYRASFEKATLVFDSINTPSLTVYKPGEEPEDITFDNVSDRDSGAGINVSNMGPYDAEISYFYDCIINDKPIDRAPLSEGVASVELAIKEWKAAKEYIAAHK